jgi:hypothetical protein
VAKKLKAELTPDSMGKIKVKFWQIIANTDPLAGSDHYVNTHDSVNNFFIQIPKRTTVSDATYFKSIPYALTEIGVVTIPFKYRFGSDTKNRANEATTAINGGLYFGRKWGRTRFYYEKDKNHESAAITAAAFAGPTKIDLTEKNVSDLALFKEASSEIGISGGAALLYSYRNFNVGFFAGADFPVTTAGKNWKYASKMWIGFGIGYMLSILHGNK